MKAQYTHACTHEHHLVNCPGPTSVRLHAGDILNEWMHLRNNQVTIFWTKKKQNRKKRNKQISSNERNQQTGYFPAFQ